MQGGPALASQEEGLNLYAESGFRFVEDSCQRSWGFCIFSQIHGKEGFAWEELMKHMVSPSQGSPLPAGRRLLFGAGRGRKVSALGLNFR